MTTREMLFADLERIVANCCRLLELAKPEDYGWRPRDNMRTLLELANHLAQVPGVDLLILQGVAEHEVSEQERLLRRDDAAGLLVVLRQGTADLERFMEKQSVDAFEHNSSTAYYGRTQTYAQWLLEALTHMYHHRGQYFNYLKLLGYDINTRTLYM
jgi:uncharacterized damage-inducible protein DinB